MGAQEDRIAEAVGPALQPGDGTYATIDHPGQSHGGHQDTFLVRKDSHGNVSVTKEHVSDDGNSWW